MSHLARNNPSRTDPVVEGRDEASTIRPRETEAGERAPRESSAELEASPARKRPHSSTRPAAGSLDDRLDKKMQAAGELMKHLPPNDARVRLLHAAILRRDEALLDGLLAELNRALPAR